jgi:hypothetical protein
MSVPIDSKIYQAEVCFHIPMSPGGMQRLSGDKCIS